MKKHLYVQFFTALISFTAFGQSSLFFRNNSSHPFLVSVQQTGTVSLTNNEFTLLEDTLLPWKFDDTEVFRTNRDSLTIPLGDTVYYSVRLQSNFDTLWAKLRIVGITGGSSLDYSVSGPGFSGDWFNNVDFHSNDVVLAGKNAIIRFKPDNDDTTFSRNIRIALHQYSRYEINSADFQNPNVLNAMSYNIQMLPFGVSGLQQANTRADLIPNYISPYQDVAFFEEAMDPTPIDDHLTPSMALNGFTHRTDKLNEGALPFPWNGGVLIFSKWPIEYQDEIDFELCGQQSQDCLANKGVKYARINKLGKKYHIFATHMDAGSQADDIAARYSQVFEMRKFIADMNIPNYEPVIFGGDLNTSPLSLGPEDAFAVFRDSMQPIYPSPTGHFETNFSYTSGKFIDHIWGDSKHLIPLKAEAKSITLTSINDDIWDLSNLSDHRTVVGRFEYPDVTVTPTQDNTICPGDSVRFSGVSTNPVYEYQWIQNGMPVAGQTANEYFIPHASPANTGEYDFRISYTAVLGEPLSDNTHFFFPNGAITDYVNLDIDRGLLVVVNQPKCSAGIDDLDKENLNLFPNPNTGQFILSINQTISASKMEVYSATGDLVYQQAVQSGANKISIPVHAAGLYFVVLKTNNDCHKLKLQVE